MGWIVESQGRVVWSPGKASGRLFLGEVKLLEYLVGEPSGVESPVADAITIDADRFTAFIRTTVDFLDRTNSGPIIAMSSGCLQVCIALQREIQSVRLEIPDRLQPYLAGADTVLRAVPLERRNAIQGTDVADPLVGRGSEHRAAP